MTSTLLYEMYEYIVHLFKNYLNFTVSNVEDELRHKIDEEKREIECLRLEVARYTGSKPAIPLSPPLVPQRRSLQQVVGARQSSVGTDDDLSQISDEELRELYERLARDNERLRVC